MIIVLRSSEIQPSVEVRKTAQNMNSILLGSAPAASSVIAATSYSAVLNRLTPEANNITPEEQA